MKADILLIHPPSLYDFREKAVYYGPISDVVPSTPVFELYPVGFLSIFTHLGERGYKVRILNLAARMLMSSKYDPERAIKKAEAEVYGIDLHWLVHVQGAVEVAKLVKKYHPDKPVVFGGVSATIFWREILENYPFVDFVMLGDSVEKPLEVLLRGLLNGEKSLDDVPNLAWRKGGRIKVTGIKWVPKSLDECSIDYGYVIKESLRSGDILSSIPFAKFLSEPIGTSLSLKGCVYECITCGGSRFAYKRLLNRDFVAFKSPQKIVEEINSLQEYMRIPVFILGDIQLMGRRNVELLSKLLHESKVDTTIFFEFFKPPSRDLLSVIRKACPRIVLQISPESHEEHIRWAFGRRYGNNELIHFIRNVLELKFEKLDLYFMIGLPGQEFESVMEIPSFVENIIKETRPSKGVIDPFIAPLAPFIDPGSKVYANPERYGYKLFFKSLEEHRTAIEKAVNWKYLLNYETKWMKREEIVRATYEAAEKMIRVKIKYGVVSEEDGLRTINLIRKIKDVISSDELKLRLNKPITVREIVPKGDLYPTRQLILSLKPKVLIALLEGLIRRCIS
ncbi:TIGR04190 family B12-binding domain/radical SAM domain protein [Candidatus Geothermarchaeota archaeon]|nr:MAG: TIGR04190 family B12-binding domain/radical SAM domain protein [Candidatus Geothermarchaeota archaeon]